MYIIKYQQSVEYVSFPFVELIRNDYYIFQLLSPITVGNIRVVISLAFNPLYLTMCFGTACCLLFVTRRKPCKKTTNDYCKK